MGVLQGAPLFYPSAREWMWQYCIYLGPFTDSRKNNYDLGIYIEDPSSTDRYSNASVYGDSPGSYLSGDFFDSEITQEVCRRANYLGIVKEGSKWHKDHPDRKILFENSIS